MKELLIIMGLLILLSNVAYGGTESVAYNTNVSIRGCNLTNGTFNEGSVYIETTNTNRLYNTSITANYSFISDIIFNVSEISCPPLKCTLNQTVYINQTCSPVTVEPAVCPDDEDQPVCPTGTTCQAIPVIKIEEPEEESSESNNGLYIVAGILLIIGYFWYKKKYSGVKQNESQTEESGPKPERRDFKRPGG